jgi:hypothetical protein
MTLAEMKTVASDTLEYFIRIMPEAPFTTRDIIIEFVPKGKMSERARSLCKTCCPDKIINETQAAELEGDIGANALIGREKSAVIIRIDLNRRNTNLRAVVFHELSHIYCAKLEMDEEHFIDIYGSGTTPENPRMTPAERTYDGYLVAGYQVWSEFIAQYYALKYTEKSHPKTARVSDYINELLSSVGENGIKGDKYALAFACARWLTCSDADKSVEALKNDPVEPSLEQSAFEACLFMLHYRVKTETSWRINEEFVADLGYKYLMFKLTSSIES